jgi:hypothetical protein
MRNSVSVAIFAAGIAVGYIVRQKRLDDSARLLLWGYKDKIHQTTMRVSAFTKNTRERMLTKISNGFDQPYDDYIEDAYISWDEL